MDKVSLKKGLKMDDCREKKLEKVSKIFMIDKEDILKVELFIKDLGLSSYLDIDELMEIDPWGDGIKDVRERILLFRDLATGVLPRKN